MYFQQIYRFEVDLIMKLAMSLPPEQSRPRETSRVEKSCARFDVDTGGFTSSFSLAADYHMQQTIKQCYFR